MEEKLTKIVEERITSWEHQSAAKKISTPADKSYPVITISRDFGGRGAALATLIGEKVGFKVWNDELLEAIADDLGSEEEFIKSLDERRREMVEDAVLGFLKNINTNVNYIRSLKRVVKTIESHGNAIIVGRGSNYICENPRSFHIRIVATLKKRVAGLSKRESITKNEALSRIKEKDTERAEFVNFNFKKDTTEPSDYDMILNSGTFSLNDMMSIIIEGYEKKTGRHLKVLN